MYKFVLSTDSCCDELKSALLRDDIEYIAMPFITNEENYDNFSNWEEYKHFFDEMRRGMMPTTASLSIGELEEYFEKLVEKYNMDILHFALSSGLSVTYENTCKAAKTVMDRHPNINIYIPDTKAVTQGLNILVQIAKEWRNQGKSAKATNDHILSVAPNVHHWFYITDLFHLKRGGRISTAQAALGSLVKARIVCDVLDNGKLGVYTKTMGTKKAIKCLAGLVLDYGTDLTNQTIYICHTDDALSAELLKTFIVKEVPRAKAIINYIGPVIAAHTGPEAVGVTFIGKPRLSDKTKKKD